MNQRMKISPLPINGKWYVFYSENFLKGKIQMVMKVYFLEGVSYFRVWRPSYPKQTLQEICGRYDHASGQNQPVRTINLNGSKKGGES
jgi:hypothetical protein